MFRSILMAACLAAISAGACLAQVVTVSPATAGVRSPTVAQRNWLDASPQQRVRIAEQIGDDGARAMAKAKGYKTLFDGFGRSLPQGPDQVYQASDGRIIAFEAKGGTGQLGHGYGYLQGSTEWAVESAKRVLGSSKTGPTEKTAARQILEAVSRGEFEVHVVRTRHVLGEPMAAVQEAVTITSNDAVRLANSAMHDYSRTARTVIDGAGRTASVMRSSGASVDDVVQTAQHVKVARTATKALLVVGVAVDAGVRTGDATAVERQYAAGAITQEQREVEHAANAAGMAGGWCGAIGGAKGGAVVGSMIGGPWGAAAGGVIGGIGGYFGGEAVAQATARWTMARMHETGMTLSEAWNRARNF